MAQPSPRNADKQPEPAPETHSQPVASVAGAARPPSLAVEEGGRAAPATEFDAPIRR
jgi:hypothetical protein